MQGIGDFNHGCQFNWLFLKYSKCQNSVKLKNFSYNKLFFSLAKRGVSMLEKQKHRPKKAADAVSPVVGVMLMLVITIIIAAVAAAFASGIADTTEKSPVATLKISMTASGPNATIENLGGDTLVTKDLRIQTAYTVGTWGTANPNVNTGRVIAHIIDGGLAPIPENDINTTTSEYPWTQQVTNNDDIITTRTAENLFGTALLAPGTSITFDKDYFLGFDTSKRSGTSGYALSEGSVVHVTIIHTPSEAIIYDGDVILPW